MKKEEKEKKEFGEQKPEIIHNGFAEKPLISYCGVEEKPLLANDSAIHAAVEIIGHPFRELPEFEFDDKFKSYYEEQYDSEPTQEDVQDFIMRMIHESSAAYEESKAVKVQADIDSKARFESKYKASKDTKVFKPKTEKDEEKS